MSEPEPTVEQRALRGVPWSLLAYAASRVIALFGTLALARLLAPDDLGVFFTGMVVVGLVNLIGDTGLGVVLVLREELEAAFPGTVFLCMMGVAVTVAAVLTAAAGPIGDLFGSPRVGDVIPLLALAAVFTTAGYFFMSMLQRELLFKRRFAGQFAQSVGYVGVAVPAAIAGAGIWSLVFGMLTGTLLSAIVLWRLTPRHVPLSFDRALVPTAYREARPFVSQAVTAFFAYNAHLLAVASVLGSRAMGVYSMSFRLAELPQLALTTPVSQATLPAFAQLGSEEERKRAALLTSLQYVALAGFPVTFGLAALSQPFQEAVLGPKWESMPLILSVLAVWGALSVVTGTISWYVNASGGAGWLAKLYTGVLVIIPICFAAALVFDSPVAVAAVLAAGIFCELLLLLRHVHHQLGLRIAEVMAVLKTSLAASCVLALAALGTWLLLDAAGLGPGLQLAAGGAVGVGAYLLAVRLFDRTMLRRGVELLRRSLSSAG